MVHTPDRVRGSPEPIHGKNGDRFGFLAEDRADDPLGLFALLFGEIFLPEKFLHGFLPLGLVGRFAENDGIGHPGIRGILQEGGSNGKVVEVFLVLDRHFRIGAGMKEDFPGERVAGIHG